MEPESPEAAADKSTNKPEIDPTRPLGVDKRMVIIVAVLFIGSVGYLLMPRKAPNASVPPTPASAPPIAAEVKAAEAAVIQNASAENYLSLSLAYSKAQRFQESLDAAKNAVRLRPNYAEAFNNEAAAYEDLHQWDDAIAAAREALRLKPDFTLARNNLIYAESQKANGR